MAVSTKLENVERELNQARVSIKSYVGALAHEDKLAMCFASNNLRRYWMYVQSTHVDQWVTLQG